MMIKSKPPSEETTTLKSKDRILQAIEKFEKKTDVEIKLVIEPKSMPYWGYLVASTLVTNFLLWLVIVYLELDFEMYFDDILVETIILDVVVFFFLGFLRGVQFLIPKSVMHSKVDNESHRFFSQFKVYQTQKRTGVLLYYSRFEKMSRIIADINVTGKVDINELDKFNNELQKSLNSPDFVEKLIEFLNQFGDFLKQKIPYTSQGNQLSDEIIGKLK